MDPNALLFQLREAIERLDDASDDERAAIHSDITHDFRELDAWITKGGFLPAVWSEAQRRALENTQRDCTMTTLAGTQIPVPCPPPGDTVDEISGLLGGDPWRGPRFAGGVTAAEVLGQVRGDA